MDGSLGIAGLSDDFGQSQRRTAVAYYFQDDKRVIETAKKILIGDKRRRHDRSSFACVFRYSDQWSNQNYDRVYTTKTIFVSRSLFP